MWNAHKHYQQQRVQCGIYYQFCTTNEKIQHGEKHKKINLINLKCSCRWAPVVWWRALLIASSYFHVERRNMRICYLTPFIFNQFLLALVHNTYRLMPGSVDKWLPPKCASICFFISVVGCRQGLTDEYASTNERKKNTLGVASFMVATKRAPA